MTPELRVNRAARAQALLSDDLLVGALRDMRDAYVAAWTKTDARDTLGRELAWMGVKAVELFQAQLRRHVNDGKLAQADIDAR